MTWDRSFYIFNLYVQLYDRKAAVLFVSDNVMADSDFVCRQAGTAEGVMILVGVAKVGGGGDTEGSGGGEGGVEGGEEEGTAEEENLSSSPVTRHRREVFYVHGVF